MTNIKLLNDRIIFDGHADTRQECETITLMCDNLAKSKDFKTVRYESGYAEFGKVGQTEKLMFVASGPSTITMVFDSHVTKVQAIDYYGNLREDAKWTTSGQTITVDGGTQFDLVIFLQEGYEVASITNSNGETINLDVKSDGTVYFYQTWDETIETITITSKQAVTKQTIDVSTLSGWASLASGAHSITIKTKASGYEDSASSNAVSVTKAAVGYKLTVTLVGDYKEDGRAHIVYADGTEADVNADGTYNNVATVKYVSVNLGNYVMKDSSGGSHSAPYNLTSDTTLEIEWMPCIIEGTQITLADGTKKAIEDITYDDELLVWNFYEGKFDTAKPSWIKVEQTTSRYCLAKFSNGAEVGFVGPGEHTRQSDGGRGYHRIFNKEAGAFTYVGTEETPIGTTTFADDNSFPTVVSQEIVEKEVKFYNVSTEKHYNLFANGILTSCRLSNMYRIENMKYVGERLITDGQVKAYFEARKGITKTRLTTDR